MVILLGIANEHLPYGNISLLKEISRRLKPFEERKNLLYVNFNNGTNPEIRNKAYEYFKTNFGNSTDVDFMGYRFDDYWRTMGNTQFVVSPIGG